MSLPQGAGREIPGEFALIKTGLLASSLSSNREPNITNTLTGTESCIGTDGGQNMTMMTHATQYKTRRDS